MSERAFEDPEMTPTHKPVTRDEWDGMRKAVHNAEQHCIATNSAMQESTAALASLARGMGALGAFEKRMTTVAAVCVACCFASLVSAVVAIAANTAQAHPSPAMVRP